MVLKDWRTFVHVVMDDIQWVILNIIIIITMVQWAVDEALITNILTLIIIISLKIRDPLLLLGLSDLGREAHSLMRVGGSFLGDEVKMGNSDLGREGLPSRRCLFRSSCKRRSVRSFFWFFSHISICLNYQGCRFLPPFVFISLSFLSFFKPESCPFS